MADPSPSNPDCGYSPDPSGVAIPCLPVPWDWPVSLRTPAAAVVLPDCPHARANAGPGCLPIRCWAYRGCSCGGSHSDAAHCARCLRSPER